jgi:hypothetical protein
MGISPSQGLYLHTRQYKTEHTQKSMPQVGFEPATPVLERVKAVHILDRVSTVIGCYGLVGYINCY